jgi:PKD repeat protein
MKMKFTLIKLFIYGSVFSQLHDNTWLLGYQGSGDNYGITQFNFSEGSLKLSIDPLYLESFIINNATISSYGGVYFASFNGYWIYDASHKRMLNGDSIWYTEVPYLFGYADESIPQGGMFLPWPNHPDSILLFYCSQGNAEWPTGGDLASLNLYYALIQKSGNGGLGEVLQRRVSVVDDTIQYGRISVARHANGRDWWMLINERNTNRYYRVLIDPYGMHVLDSQTLGLPVIDGLGQAVFSPNGTLYAIKNSVSASVGNYVDVYSFDRCSGLLSNHRQLYHPGSATGGVAISPNARYLYVSFNTTVYQYDLYSDDLEASKILVGEYEPDSTFPPARFFTLQLAPDNKIYISALNFVKVIHLIHDPDKPGQNCNFQQKGVILSKYNSSALSYSPYYRLGPIDGSDCDSLGLDNFPKAWYRYEQDTLNPLAVGFTDLSYYEPANWSWDFGDGSTGSNDRHPEHLFDSTGAYTVCLTVNNVNGSDTHCKTLYLGISAQDNPVLQNQISLFPNPFNNRLHLVFNTRLYAPRLRLYNWSGVLIREEQINTGINEIDTGTWPAGMYFWEVISGNERIRTGKAVKGH